LYNNEEIEKIFKYREKKKNIIGIFKFWNKKYFFDINSYN
jgi:hypothetical protein